MTMEHFNPQSGHIPDAPGGDGSDSASVEQIDLVGTATSKKRVSDATIVLVGTLLVGAGILTGMRWLGTKSSSFGVDQAIEKTVNEFLGRATPGSVKSSQGNPADTDAMLSSLTDDRTEAQVQLEYVKKNPFVLHLAGAASNANPEDGVDLAAQREQARLAELRRTLDRNARNMRLSSIMGQPGKRVAVLDDLVVQVGDVINETFKVKAITAFEVVLEAEGMEFRKSLKE